MAEHSLQGTRPPLGFANANLLCQPGWEALRASHQAEPEKAKDLLSKRIHKARLSRKGRTRMIRKLKSGEYRLYSRKKSAQTGKRRNLGTFKTRQAAERHEREVQFFKQH